MNEEERLRQALALDEDELAFLRAAVLPARFAARIAAERRAVGRSFALDLLWIVAPVALGYVGWLAVAPLVGSWLALAGQVGMTSLLAAQVARGAWAALDGLASLIEAASAVPGFDAPLALISVLAALVYVVGLTVPRVRRVPAGV
jgi:hypothetical protein